MFAFVRASLFVLFATASAVAVAQTFPAKPLRIVVAFPAGGPIDIVARTLAPKLFEAMGQQVIVDNRAGANGVIGTDHVAKSAPDGYTMILASPSAIAINPAISKVPFDTLRDLACVSLVTSTPELLVVHPSVPAKTPREVIARLNEAIVKSLNDRNLREQLISRGAEPIPGAPEQFTLFLQEDMKRWAKIAKASGIKME